MEETKDNLNEKQELFCRYYTQNNALFGNATLSYAEAYGFDLDTLDKDDGIWEFKDGTTMTVRDFNVFDLPAEEWESLKHQDKRLIKESTYKNAYDNCSQSGSRLLRLVKINLRITELLNEIMTDEVIDARLTKIILHGKDSDSISAIKEYNALKARIIKKLDLSTMGEKIPGVDLEALATAMAEELKKEKT